MRFGHIAGALAALSATANAVSPSWMMAMSVSDAAAGDDQVLPPSQDPWYAAPEGYESASPGDILKVRVAPGNLAASYGAGQAYNILYRSTNSRQLPSWGVTTLFVPATASQAAELKKLGRRHADPLFGLPSFTIPGLTLPTLSFPPLTLPTLSFPPLTLPTFPFPGLQPTTSSRVATTTSVRPSSNSNTPTVIGSTTKAGNSTTTVGTTTKAGNSTATGPAGNSNTPTIIGSTTRSSNNITTSVTGGNRTTTTTTRTTTRTTIPATNSGGGNITPPPTTLVTTYTTGRASSSTQSYTTSVIGGGIGGGNGSNGTVPGNGTVGHGNGTTNGTSNYYKLLSYQLPYDSAFIDSSPSYALHSGGNGDISTALQSGWFVNVPDYEGPTAAFTAGHQSGQSTLDSVRAVLTDSYGLSKTNTRYVMWGYSGGALASEWASELQYAYAPELSFAGAALGGLTPNITTVAYLSTSTLFAGLIPSGILGLTTQWPALADFVQAHLKTTGPYNATSFYKAFNYTLIQSIGAFLNQPIEEYFDNAFADLSSPVALQVINADGIMGTHGVPRIPLYVYKGVNDQISPVNETDALVDKYCSKGVTIQYQRDLGQDHITEEGVGTPGAVAFLTKALSGTFTQKGCVITNVTASS